MGDDLDWPNEPLFDFSETLSLQTLASTKLALSLWRNKICNQRESINLEIPVDIPPINECSPHYLRRTIISVSKRYFHAVWKRLSSSCLDEKKKFSCQDIIVVPTRIGDLIDERIVSIGNELQIWLKKLIKWCPEISQLRDPPIRNFVEMFSVFFDNVVLEKDCTICLRRTVKGVLTSTEVEIAPDTKYRMEYEFCRENCVRELWPLESNNLNEVCRCSLMLYWNDVMMSKSDEGYFVTYKKWIALEYFWNKFSIDEQTTRTIDVLRNADCRVIKRFLPKLNGIQIRRVWEDLGDRIFGEMLKEDEYFELAVKLWTCMKDSVSPKVFHGVLRHSWLFVFNPSKSNIVRISQRKALLHDVWTSASDQLKAFVLNRHNFVELFSKLDDELRSFDNYDFEFLLELMTNVDFELRSSVWQKHYRKLVIRLKPSKLEELMRLCLANGEEIEQFKEQKMANFEEFESYFSFRVNYGSFDEVIEYLDLFVNNPECLENLHREIIMSNLVSIFSYDDKKFAEFDSFVRSDFHDPLSARKFIEELILSPEFLWVIHCKLDEGRFDEVVSTVSRFPSCEKHINEMKRAFPEYCKSNLTHGQIIGFEGRKFERFLRWCCLNKTAVFEFKKLLNIDDIFLIIANKVIEDRRTFLHTSPTILDFDRFLEWYFGSSRDAKVYKSTRMFHHEEIQGLKIALREAGSKFIHQFLKWAFDDDTSKIAIVKCALYRASFDFTHSFW